MRLIILAGALLLPGCGTLENARAAKQADQAVEAIAKTVQAPTFKEDLDNQIPIILTLADSARTSLEPVIKELSNNEVVEVPTCVEDALANAHVFAIKAAMQAGRAQAEADRNNRLRSMAAASGSGLAGILALLAGSGTAGAGLLMVFNLIKKYKSAIGDAVAYGKDVTSVDPKDDAAIEDIKQKHAAVQKAKGTKAIIESALTKHKA